MDLSDLNIEWLKKAWKKLFRFATKTKRRKILSGLLVILMAISLWKGLEFIFPGSLAAWWDDSWLYRKKITFGNSGSATTDEMVSFSIDTESLISNGKLQSGCQDIRFTDSSNTLLDHRVNGNQIQYKADVSETSGSSSSSVSYSHTVTAGNNQVLVVTVHAHNSQVGSRPVYVNSVTFNGDSMTEQIEYSVGHPTTTNRDWDVAIYTLVNPDVATGNVVITFSDTADRYVSSAMTFENVDQTTPVGATSADVDSASDSTFDITTTYDNSYLVGGSMREQSSTDLIYLKSPGKHTYEAAVNTGGVWIEAGGGFQYAEAAGSHTITTGPSEGSTSGYNMGAVIELKRDPSLDCNKSTTNFEVALPSISSGTNTVYAYYGNSSASDASSTLIDTSKSIAYKEVTDASTNGSSTTQSFSHTVTAGSNQTLVVVTGMQREQSGDVPTDVQSVTFNGDKLVRQSFADYYTTNRNDTSEVWTLVNPDVTSGTVLITYDSAHSGARGAAALTVENTVQNYVPVANGNSDTSVTSFDVDLTTTKNNSLIIAGGTRHRNAAATDVTYTSGTEVYDQQQADGDSSTSISMAGGYQAAIVAGSQTANFTAANATAWTGGAVALEPELTYDEFTPTSGPTIDSEEIGAIPLVYWKMDEGVDDTCPGGSNDVCDSSPNGFDAPNTGGVWQTEDKCISGKCMLMGQSTDTSIKAGSTVDIPSEYTLSLWLKGDISKQNAENIYVLGFDGKIAIYVATSGSNPVYSMLIRNAADSGYNTVNASRDVLDNKWHHLSVTVETDLTVTMYLDGEQVRSDSVADHYSGTLAPIVGSFSSTYGNFTGFIDEAKIYPYARTPAEVKADYIKGAGRDGSGAVLGFADNEYLNDGLIGYWKLDESIANTCTGSVNDSCDSSGRSLDGAWGNNATATAGKFGRGVVFDGSGDYINMGDLNEFEFTSDFTVAGWVKPTNLDTADAEMAGKGCADNSGWTVGIDGTTDLPQFESNGTDLTGNTVLVNDNWYHLTYTVDPSGDVRIYVNGVLDNSPTNLTLSTHTSSGLNIGGCNNTSESFEGTIDEVRIYNRTLSPNEVNDLYNWAPGPTGHWKLDENTGGDGDKVYDTSGNANNGTISIGGGDTTQKWFAGLFGSAFNFDGSDDYISVGDVDLYDMGTSQDFTASVWVKTSINPVTDAYPIVLQKDGGSPRYGYTILANLAQYSDNWQGEIYVNGSKNPGCDSGIDITDGAWHHLSMIRSASTVYLYTDGVLSNSCSGSSADISNSGGLNFASYSGAGGGYLDGLIDDIRIYNYARKPSQVIEDLNAGHPVGGSPISSKISHYKFDEMSGDTAYDSGISGNDGDLYGSCPGSSTCPTWTKIGKSGGALDFNISDAEHVAITTPENIDTSGVGKGSISFWMQPGWNSNVTTTTHAITGAYDLVSSFDGFALVFLGSDNGGAGDLYLESVDNTYLQSAAIVSNSNLSWSAGDWVHVTLTWDDSLSSDNMIIYLNGVKVPQSITTPGSFDLSSLSIPSSWNIGNLYSGYPFSFDGLIDDYKIYNDMLTPSQVLIDYNSGSTANFGTSTNEKENIVDGDYTSNLVGYWPMDENTGTTSIYDKSGNNHTGTMGGSMTTADWVPGKYGSALDFDGTNDEVGAADASDLDITGDFTLMAWVNRTAGTGSRMVVSKRPNSSHSGGYSLTVGNTGEVYCQTDDGSSTQINSYTSAGLVDVGSGWHHLAAVRSGTSCRVYVDGVDETTSADTHTTLGTNNEDLTIGAAPNGAEYWYGYIDEVKVYNNDLTPAQIAYEYNRGAPLAWWRFDECQGTVANDASGNGNSGTITEGGSGSNNGGVGSCNSGSGDEMWDNGSVGKFSSALDFDGTDDKVAITSDVFDVGTGDFSISLWANIDAADQNDRIFSVGNANHYEIWVNSSGTILAYGGDSSSSRTAASSNASSYPGDGLWHHITAVYDRDYAISLYIDGQLQDDVETSYSSYSSTDYNLTSCEIGGYVGGSAYNYDGQLDDVRFYNYTLSPDQVKQIMTGSAVRFE